MSHIAIAGIGSAGHRMISLCNERSIPWRCYDPLSPSYLLDSRSAPTWGQALLGAKAAIICSPPSEHYRQAAQALTAGVPVLIEKPLATEYRLARLLVALQRKTGTDAFVGYNLRMVDELADVILAAKRNAYLASAFFSYDLRKWRPGQPLNKGYAPWRARGGGILLDASHELDSLVRMFGRPTSVSAVLRSFRKDFKFGDTESGADLLLAFRGDRTAMLHVDYLGARYMRAVWSYGKTEEPTWDSKWQLYSPTAECIQQSYARTFDAFIDRVSRRQNPDAARLCTVAEAAQLIEIIDAARRSAKEHRIVSLAPQGAKKGRG